MNTTNSHSIQAYVVIIIHSRILGEEGAHLLFQVIPSYYKEYGLAMNYKTTY